MLTELTRFTLSLTSKNVSYYILIIKISIYKIKFQNNIFKQ